MKNKEMLETLSKIDLVMYQAFVIILGVMVLMLITKTFLKRFTKYRIGGHGAFSSKIMDILFITSTFIMAADVVIMIIEQIIK